MKDSCSTEFCCLLPLSGIVLNGPELYRIGLFIIFATIIADLRTVLLSLLFYNLPTKVTELEDGIIVILEHEEKVLCVFVDALIGEQEIVVKPLPKYIKQVRGVSGCTQLGDGSISLILDAASLIMQTI